MKNHERITKRFELKSIKDSENDNVGRFEGWAYIYDEVSSGNEIVLRNALTESLNSKTKKIPILRSHNMEEVIGGVNASDVQDKEEGLYMKGELDLNVQAARETYSLMKHGFLNGISLGGWSYYSDESINNDGVTEIAKMQLEEISIVPVPAIASTKITRVYSVPPYKDYAMVERDVKWDASKAIQQIKEKTKSMDGPSSTYKNGFMYFDSTNPDVFSSYKLPYVYVVNGEFKAVPNAIIAINGVLNGAMGGVDIPTSDKEKVQAQVDKYYKKMGMDKTEKKQSLNANNVDAHAWLSYTMEDFTLLRTVEKKLDKLTEMLYNKTIPT
jgi:HK97 family phage prohead protease